MKLHLLLNRHNEWISGQGTFSDVVMSTRIRIARNREDLPFPYRATEQQRQEVVDDFKSTVGHIEELKNCLFVELSEIEDLDRNFLLERHLVSKELIQPGVGKGVVISHDEKMSVMLNEEDHFRMQILLPGFELDQAWSHINELDEHLGARISYAFCPRFGFLTSCPTNVGTGLRASTMLHLPALAIAKQINQVLQATIKLGLTFRGLYGEGSDVVGNIFQVSNQITLGFSEEDIVGNLKKVIGQIIEHERNARKYLLKTEYAKLEDAVWRAYGLLTSARIIDSKEAIDLLSMLRLGVNLGIIGGISLNMINELFILLQSAHLQIIAKKQMSAAERDQYRADVIRKKLTSGNPK